MSIPNSQLQDFVARIERLEEDKRVVADDIREVYDEAKDAGYTPKAMREIVRERRQDQRKLRVHQALLDVYRRELGMLADTPLGEAAARVK
jgi:uncharacterized protein (UPF0335 family)